MVVLSYDKGRIAIGFDDFDAAFDYVEEHGIAPFKMKRVCNANDSMLAVQAIQPDNKTPLYLLH